MRAFPPHVALPGRSIAAGMILAGFAAGGVAAQIPDEPPTDAVLQAGPVLFYPIFNAGIERTDNLFYRNRSDPANVVEATVATATAGVVAELPFSHSRARIGYAARERSYSAGQPDNRSHFFKADTRLVFGNGMVVGVSGDYSRGVLDTQIFDPGGEITFSGERFERTYLEAEWAVERSGRRPLRVLLRRDDTRFLGERVSGFFDVQEDQVAVQGEWHVRPRAWAVWEVFASDADLMRPATSGFPEETRSERDLSLRAGLGIQLGPGTGLVGSVGWARYRFREATGETFSGLVASVEYQRSSRGGLRVVSRLSRDAYPSIFTNNDYYVNNQARVEVTWIRERRLAPGGALSYYVNEYPEITVPRRDNIRTVEAWLGYRFGGWLELRTFVNHGRRNSTAPSSGYDVTRFGTSVRWVGE